MQNMDVMNISTLGDLIKFHREKKDFSLDQLSRKTKIRIKQLINLEENKFNELPNRVYLVGFLKSLSDELEMNFDIALEFLNESNTKESKESNIKPSPLDGSPKGKETRPFQFKFLRKSPDKKVILAAIFIGSFTIITIGVSIFQSTVSQLAEQDVQQTVVLSQAAVVGREVALPILPKEEVIEAIPVGEVKAAPVAEVAPAAPIIQQLIIKAKKGTAFLVYRIDQKNLVKVFLQQGKELELKGEQIRLDVGNVAALEFIKNGEPLTINNSARNSTVHLVFPEEKN